jgi:hypothetical protein
MTERGTVDEPPRLYESATAIVREAMIAGREDLPSRRHVQALLASASVLGGASAAAAGGGVKLAALVLAGAAVAGAAGGGVAVMARRREPPAVVAPAPPPNTPAARVEPALVPAAPEIVAAPARIAPRPRPRPAPVAKTTPPTAAPSALLEEARLVEAARATVRSDPREALRLLARRRAEHPAGALAQEADVVAIEALARDGRAAEAKAAAAEFARRYPGSPHRRTIDAIVGAAK